MTVATPPMPLSTSGRYIVDARGRRVRLAGVNWYGAHEDLGVAPGLDRADRRALARRMMLGQMMRHRDGRGACTCAADAAISASSA